MTYTINSSNILILAAMGIMLLNGLTVNSVHAQSIPVGSNNKSQLETDLLNFYPSVEVEFNGNATLVLKADEEFLLKSQGNLASLWEAIDKSHEFGYTLDEITTSGMGSEGNPTRFYAVLSLDPEK